MTHGRRRVVLGGLTLAVAVIALNIAGVLRYPGGPLREPSADGPLLLDIRPADQGSITVGNSQPSDWAVAGRPYDFGLLTIHNPTSFDVVIEAVTPIDPTTGLVLEAVYVQRPGVTPTASVGFGPSERIDSATIRRDFDWLPATVVPSGDTHLNDAEVIIVARSDEVGAFGFSALALDYRIGPFTFHAIQHLALAGCLGPLPSGTSCPQDA